jgi:hypothetical protein
MPMSTPDATSLPRRSGFDVIVGNPPWDQTVFRDQEFFASTRSDIARAPTGSAREAMIAELRESDPQFHSSYENAARIAEGARFLFQGSGHFPLAGCGRTNTFALFLELSLNSLHQSGRVGLIVPSGVATDDTTKALFQFVTDGNRLVSLFDFENRHNLFPSVDSRAKFSLLTAAGRALPLGTAADYVFFAHEVSDLNDAARHIGLTREDLSLLNPNTRTAAVFRTSREAALAKAAYRRFPVLIREGHEEGNPWGVVTRPGLFNMSGDSAIFKDREWLETHGFALQGNTFVSTTEAYLPLFEGKMFDFFDHRYASVVISATAALRQGQPERLSEADHENPNRCAIPRHWVIATAVKAAAGKEWDRDWLLGWKEITSTTNERTLIPGVFPLVAIGHKIPLLLPASTYRDLGPCLVACLSSLMADWIVRQKLGTTSLTPFTMKQMPVPKPSEFDAPSPWSASTALRDWVTSRVLELTFTAHDIAGFARDLGYDGPPFRWDPARRAQIRAELDAAFFHLYGVSRDDVSYILDTFLVFKAREEERNGGVYKTKETILAIYDEMAHAAANDCAWESPLMPLPGDPGAAHSLESLAAVSNRVVEPAPTYAPAIHTGDAADQQAAVIAAFLDVRQGRSPDYVVCEPGLNAAFIAAARDRGAVGDDAALNRTLLGARKTGALSGHPTTSEYRMPKTLMPYAFVAEWAARHLQRQELLRHDEPPSLDDILCDPSLAVQFDELASRIKPGIKPLDMRWAALGFRKTARKAAAPGSVTVEPSERVDADAGLSQLPEKPGLYLIVAGQQVLYASYTRDLRDQLTRHAEVANGALAPEWLLPKQSRPDTVRWAWLQSLNPKVVAEARIHLVTEHRPWLNLMETGVA